MSKRIRKFGESKFQNSQRQRLDSLLVLRGLAASRDRACDLIASGVVLVDGAIVRKPSKLLAESCVTDVAEELNPWVSRGGLKLAGALEQFFGYEVEGCCALDIGASTGGFTEVLLARGAAHVIAVDVGVDQLNQRLAGDPRVTVLDRTNARYLTHAMLPYIPDFIVCDASFISLRKLLPSALRLAASNAHLVALVKPQFEVGKGFVGKGGIVRDPILHQRVLTDITGWLEADMKWTVVNTLQSPIKGSDGNNEFLVLAQKPDFTNFETT